MTRFRLNLSQEGVCRAQTAATLLLCGLAMSISGHLSLMTTVWASSVRVTACKVRFAAVGLSQEMTRVSFEAEPWDPMSEARLSATALSLTRTVAAPSTQPSRCALQAKLSTKPFCCRLLQTTPGFIDVTHKFFLLEHGLLDLDDLLVVGSDGIGPAFQNRPKPLGPRGELESAQSVVEGDHVRLSREALHAQVRVRRHRLLGDNCLRHLLQEVEHVSRDSTCRRFRWYERSYCLDGLNNIESRAQQHRDRCGSRVRGSVTLRNPTACRDAAEHVVSRTATCERRRHKNQRERERNRDIASVRRL